MHGNSAVLTHIASRREHLHQSRWHEHTSSAMSLTVDASASSLSPPS